MLAALEQILDQSRNGPIEKSKSIAAVLAYLYCLQRCDRWPFDDFWKALDDPDDKIRSADLTRCLNGIYLQVGIDRTTKRKLSEIYAELGLSSDGRRR